MADHICTGCARNTREAASVKLAPGMARCTICGYSLGFYPPTVNWPTLGKLARETKPRELSERARHAARTRWGEDG